VENYVFRVNADEKVEDGDKMNFLHCHKRFAQFNTCGMIAVD